MKRMLWTFIVLPLLGYMGRIAMRRMTIRRQQHEAREAWAPTDMETGALTR
ncbi:MAG TPA: hypothetical protein VM600_09330 [Actinomycetota bacterium]|nr:hypothetical protein [Actinomycetota bacterium]